MHCTALHCGRFEEDALRASREAEKIEAVLGGLTKKNQAQVGGGHFWGIMTVTGKCL